MTRENIRYDDRMEKTICPYDCPTSCGLLVKTDGTRILEVKGDPTILQPMD